MHNPRNLTILTLFLAVSCQNIHQTPALERPKYEGPITSASLGDSGILEILPVGGGVIFFNSGHIPGVATWAPTSLGGLRSYYFAFLPQGHSHRISVSELLQHSLPSRFQCPIDLPEFITLELRGVFIASPSWPVSSEQAGEYFFIEIAFPSSWLAEALQVKVGGQGQFGGCRVMNTSGSNLWVGRRDAL